jgi:hypothetical protein
LNARGEGNVVNSKQRGQCGCGVGNVRAFHCLGVNGKDYIPYRDVISKFIFGWHCFVDDAWEGWPRGLEEELVAVALTGDENGWKELHGRNGGEHYSGQWGTLFWTVGSIVQEGGW